MSSVKRKIKCSSKNQFVFSVTVIGHKIKTKRINSHCACPAVMEFSLRFLRNFADTPLVNDYYMVQ